MSGLDRYLGCLVGLAVGDAVGTTLEFQAPGTFRPIDDMVGGGPFRLEPGQWTDDTSMALCLAESLVETGGFDPVDQLRRYVRWYREGHWSCTGRCFDIGNTTRAALHRFEASGCTQPYCGSERHDRAGNGSLMRLAPVPMAFAADPRLAVERSAESSRTTHGAAEAVDACRYFGALLAGALDGAGKAELVARRYQPAPGYWDERPLVGTVDDVACGSFRERQPPEIRGTGHAVRSLEAALWAFHHSSDFREGCLLTPTIRAAAPSNRTVRPPPYSGAAPESGSGNATVVP